ncbi:hypothetical protein F6R98_09145 [Candidatus Methylospira mobilis]|uniref:Uncharacterized protein n=1 Tax=Candidatus Methylospira mobilis TaxID=1808979 RepID=A0A5Q0BGV5_9GAMM|nr:hypothetical protein [Candidatus Methylospira mobilis]QFY42769.1 hypothetical protein F6R98_09145 [Candidatus Methylospira mobilis]
MLTYPDNPNRLERLKNLSAQLTVAVESQQKQSETFEEKANKLRVNLIKLKERLEQYLATLSLEENKELWERVKKLIDKVDSWSKDKEVTISSVKILVPTFIVTAFASGVAGYSTTKALQNLHLNRFLARLAPRQAFIYRMPGYVKWGSRAAGFGVGIIVSFAIFEIVDAFLGASTKKELQKDTKEALDSRYEATYANMHAEASIESVSDFASKSEAYKELIDKDSNLINFVIEKMDNAENDFIKHIEMNVTSDKVLTILKERDKGQWVDSEVEENWTHPEISST